MVSQTSQYKRQKRHEKRAKFIAFLGGKCVKCGSKDNLQFDHIIPSTREFMITGYGLNYGEKKILEEVKKCQLLCSPCHHKKSGIERRETSTLAHGDITMYTARKCRCDKCATTHREYQANYRRTKKQSNVV